ncbi:MAG: DUF488 domain-containing protein [Chloroflexi bacterium]|nr:MAG: DUF488 domain-containing protein [Chloroflexota bacterium]
MGTMYSNPVRLWTAGHGTLSAEAFAALLRDAGVDHLVDVRTAPGSRRHPHFARAAMEDWLPAAGIAYRWERDLGGFRRSDPGSPNTALRDPAFRGYADHMRNPRFGVALEGVLTEAASAPTVVMCSESLWWRCHRRLIADAAALLAGAEVVHLLHDRRLEAHRPTDGVRREGALLVYDRGAAELPLDDGGGRRPEGGARLELPVPPPVAVLLPRGHQVDASLQEADADDQDGAAEEQPAEAEGQGPRTGGQGDDPGASEGQELRPPELPPLS